MTSAKSSASHYSPVSVSIHWATAVLVFAALYLGIVADGTDPGATKVVLLRFHAIAGICVLGVTLFRVYWWVFYDKKPEPLPGTPKWRRILASVVHVLLITLLLVASSFGAIMIIQSGAYATLFLGSNIALPDFWEYSLREYHGLIGKIILLLVILHVVGALFHAMRKPRGYLKRMWFPSSKDK